MLALPPDEEISLVTITRHHVHCAEALAATDSISGRERLWTGDAGEHAAEFIAEILETGDAIDLSLARFAALFETLMMGHVVRALWLPSTPLYLWAYGSTVAKCRPIGPRRP